MVGEPIDLQKSARVMADVARLIVTLKEIAPDGPTEITWEALAAFIAVILMKTSNEGSDELSQQRVMDLFMGLVKQYMEAQGEQ